ncbi:MAG: LacI family DNA-binding transcriptional regulator [Opitutales bacterium]
MPPVTQKQIADELGLSPQAVNFALGHRYKMVSPATRQKVMETAERLGYRTNSAAKAISLGRFNSIGLLMGLHKHRSTLFDDFLYGLHQVLDEQGIHITLTFADDETLNDEGRVPKILGEQMVDGLLINYTHNFPKRMERLITRYKLPAIWVNSRHKSNCVYIDDESAAKEATQRLIELGHRRILFSDITMRMEDDGSTPHYSHADRYAGYSAAMEEAGLVPRLFSPEPKAVGACGVERVIKELQGKDRPTAVLGYGGGTYAWTHAAYALGLKLGSDLSYVCFESFQPFAGPVIDTLLLPEEEMGRTAGRQLMDLIDTGKRQKPQAMVPVWKKGETVGPPASP